MNVSSVKLRFRKILLYGILLLTSDSGDYCERTAKAFVHARIFKILICIIKKRVTMLSECEYGRDGRVKDLHVMIRKENYDI